MGYKKLNFTHNNFTFFLKKGVFAKKLIPKGTVIVLLKI
jgi:hypothetical protein